MGGWEIFKIQYICNYLIIGINSTYVESSNTSPQDLNFFLM